MDSSFYIGFPSIAPGIAKSFQNLLEPARNTKWNHDKMEIKKPHVYNFLPDITFPFHLSSYY